ncbi:hypothetical protein [Paracoccus versutus]|uniref:hypothetical protein n=1 Tax=Paracoccus versutus TaxID=34007 RepID=UPI001AD7FFD1|nr:hypothetical protein [Paracoccus versutus]
MADIHRAVRQGALPLPREIGNHGLHRLGQLILREAICRCCSTVSRAVAVDTAAITLPTALSAAFDKPGLWRASTLRISSIAAGFTVTRLPPPDFPAVSPIVALRLSGMKIVQIVRNKQTA